MAGPEWTQMRRDFGRLEMTSGASVVAAGLSSVQHLLIKPAVGALLPASHTGSHAAGHRRPGETLALLVASLRSSKVH